jgi:hypothetical protein
MAVWWLETSPVSRDGLDSPCRRAELKEGDVIPYVLRIALNPTGWANNSGRVMENSALQIITVTAVFSKNWDWK